MNNTANNYILQKTAEPASGGKSLISVTLAVSAYNEEQNILAWLESVARQVEDGFRLDQILVVSDGSTDRTAAIVSGFSHAKLKFVIHKQRAGKSARFKEIYAGLSSDVIVQSDADTILGHPYVIRDLIRPFYEDPSIIMCGGEAIPLPPETFMEKAVYRTAMAYTPLKTQVRGGNNIFSVTGCLLAYRSSFISSIEWPYDMASDDLYTYFICKKRGGSYRYVPTAEVYFRLPRNWHDQISQSTRFAEIRSRLKELFPVQYDQEFNVPPSLLLSTRMKEFISFPVLCLYIFFVNQFCVLRARYLARTKILTWEIASSTKQLKVEAQVREPVIAEKTGKSAGKKLFSRRTMSRAAIIGFFIFCIFILALSLRGLAGNPSAGELNTLAWKEDGPFELSPERGRFALLYSIAENDTISLSLDLAKFSAPDLGIAPDGRYVSLFQPGVSFLALPGYLAGKILGRAQIGAFAVIALFAALNALLIVLISRSLGAGLYSGMAAGLAFLFATPAYAYAVTFYQHHITVFIILSCLYLMIRFRSFPSFILFWVLTGLSLIIDSPNFFLLLPFGIYAAWKIVEPAKASSYLDMTLRPYRLLALSGLILPILLLGWYNLESHGDPFRLSGTLPAVAEVSASGEIAAYKAQEPLAIGGSIDDKQALNFFGTRQMWNGLYTFLISPDRGILWFAPVIILGVLGLAGIYRRLPKLLNLLIAVIGVNLLLYSMWGDPYGGWAFGSRYLIPAYALLAIGLALWQPAKRHPAVLLIFVLLFGFSVWVNTLGALTSNMNPPQTEILELEALSGKQEKYTFERNWDFLALEGSKSYIWRTYLREHLAAPAFHNLITFSIIALMSGIIAVARRQDGKSA